MGIKLRAYLAVAVAAAVLLAGVLGYAHRYRDAATACEARESAALRAALVKVQEQQAAMAALQRERDHAKEQADRAYRESREEIARLHGDLSRLGRLRDPGARPCSGDAVPAAAAAAGVSDGSASGAELSEAASEFFIGEAERADRAAAYATGCYQWINDLYSRGR